MHSDEVCISRKGRLVIHRMNDIQKKTVKKNLWGSSMYLIKNFGIQILIKGRKKKIYKYQCLKICGCEVRPRHITTKVERHTQIMSYLCQLQKKHFWILSLSGIPWTCICNFGPNLGRTSHLVFPQFLLNL